jgi:hypothetical protein
VLQYYVNPGSNARKPLRNSVLQVLVGRNVILSNEHSAAAWSLLLTLRFLEADLGPPGPKS